MTKFSSLSIMVATCLICSVVQAQESIEQICFDSTSEPAWAVGCTGLAAGAVYACPFEGRFELSICADAGTAPSEGEFDSWVCAFSDNLVSGTVQQLDQEAAAALQSTNWTIEGINPGPFNRSNCTELSPMASPSPSPSPSLSIEQNTVIITQGVNNFTFAGQASPTPNATPGSTSDPIALVQGKSTVVLATVSISNPTANDQTPMTVTATMSDGSQMTSTPIPMASISPNGTQITIASILPQESGQGTVSLVASAADATSSTPVQESVVTEATRSINVGFLPINGCGGGALNCYEGTTVTGFDADVENAGTFIQATYPIPDQGSSFSGVTPSTPFAGELNQSGDEEDWDGMNLDLLNLGILAKVSFSQLNYLGGIVPSGYFKYHNDPTACGYSYAGFTPPFTGHVFLSEDGYWDTAAHEMGHLFGLPDYYTDNSPVCPVTASGFDTQGIINFGPISLSPGLMCENYEDEIFGNWIDSGAYNKIFQGLMQPASDPEVLLVAGILTSDGQFQSGAFYDIASGTASAGGPGNFSLTVLSQSGESLYQLNEQTSFFAFADPVAGTPIDNVTTGQIPVNSIPVLLTVPYSSAAGQVQIVYNGKTILSVSPSSQLLIAAIQALPDSSFKRDPKRELKALLAQANEIDRLLNECQVGQSGHDKDQQVNCVNRAILLTLNLRAEIDLLLNDSTATTSPLQMTKSQVLATVDSAILHMLPTMTIPGHNHPFQIWGLPPENEDDRNVFNVVSVTQGANGTTAVNKDGAITYQPTGAPKADSFTVTLQDEEGATVVRTVNITAPPMQCDLHGKNFDYFGRWGGQ